jgi:hypothetical protein
LQRDSTRLFPKLLRMFRNAIASLGTQPADVPYARTVVVRFLFTGNIESIWGDRYLRRPQKKGVKKITSSGVKK